MAEAKTILIVDDDLMVREMYEDRLKQAGYMVVGAGDGEEAIEKAIDIIPSVILLDIMMPRMNGIDVMQRLRSDDRTKDIPVIILTALIQEIDKIKKLMTERDSYFVKSEKLPKDIIETVSKILDSE